MSSTVEPLAVPAEHEPSRSSADRFMRRLLRLSDEPRMSAADARSSFQKSLAFTACRCILLYLVFPFVLPPLGVAVGVGPVIGIAIGLIAMASIVYSIRRFWRADHSKRWHYTVFGTVIIGFLIYLTIKDLAELFG
ncbi:MAG: hypothetical protein AB8G26_16130 [Ilumatobacter sp.]